MPLGAGPKPIGRDLYQAPKRLTYTSGSRLPCHCEKRSDEAISHPASTPAFPRGGLRRRFASRNDSYLAQLAAGESIIRAPGIRIQHRGAEISEKAFFALRAVPRYEAARSAKKNSYFSLLCALCALCAAVLNPCFLADSPTEPGTFTADQPPHDRAPRPQAPPPTKPAEKPS